MEYAYISSFAAWESVVSKRVGGLGGSCQTFRERERDYSGQCTNTL